MARWVLVFGVAGLALGCAPGPEGPEDESAAGADAVKVAEVVESGAAPLLEGFDAGDDARHDLGIRRWHVFATYDAETRLVGTVAYGVGDDDHVRYSVVVTRRGADDATLAMVRFDEAGPAADQSLRDDDRAVLREETARVARALEHRRATSQAGCVAGLGAALLVGVAATGVVVAVPVLTGAATAAAAVADVALALGLTAGVFAHVTTWLYGWPRTMAAAGIAVELVASAAVGTAKACREVLADR